MQGALLAMGIYFELKSERAGAEEEEGDDDDGAKRARRPVPARAYSEGLAEGLPGPFTGHPELYAETQDEMDRLLDREERAVERETSPLLRPGGIGGSPRSGYRGTG